MARHEHHDTPVDTGQPDQEGLPKDRPRSVLRRIIGGVVSYGVILIVFVSLLNKLRDAQASGQEIAPITVGQVAVVTVLGLINICTNQPPIILTLPGLRFRESFVSNTAGAALSNTVPEGGAVATGLNFAILRSWGFTLDRITSSYLTTGIWTNLCRYSLLALALLALTATETVASWVPWVALGAVVLMATAVALLVLALHSEGFAQRLGRIIGRLLRPVMRIFRKPEIDNMEERVDDFRKLIAETAGNVWRSLTATMLLSQFTAFVILGVALRMQGIDESTVSWSRIIVAWGGMSLASLIVPTPGGLGVAEAALAAILSPVIPESQTASMVSAIVLFRGATWFLPIPIGSVSYLFWRKNTKWRRTPEDRYGTVEGEPDVHADPAGPGVVPAAGS
jgi:putative heme transporter